MSTAANTSDAAGAAPPARRTFLAWYRRYYLLVNLPILFLITELALVRADLVHRPPFDDKDDLAKGLAAYDARPPAPGDEVMLLLGNSATDRGFDAKILERELGNPRLRIYNFGLKGARLDDQLGLIEHLAGRGIAPKYVLLGVNPYVIDHLVNVDTLYPWLERRTPYVYFHRSRIRTKLWRWLKLVVGIEKPKAPSKAPPPDLDPEQATTRLPEKAIQTYVTQFANRPPDDFPMVNQLSDFADWLTRRGIRPYFVILPMAAGGTRRVPEYEPLMARIRTELPPGLDLSRAPERFPDGYFYDVGHPNADGRVAFTRELAAWLKTRQELLPR